jgi:hypothetical protein
MPSTATMKPATTAMKCASAASMEATACAVETGSSVTVESDAVTAANVCSAVSASVSVGIPAVSVIAAVAMSIVTTVSIIAAVAPIAAIPVEPGSSADEHAAYEPARPVEAVRSACIGIIIVVPIRANRSRAIIPAIHRPNSNSHGNLCLRRCRCHKSQNRQ